MKTATNATLLSLLLLGAAAAPAAPQYTATGELVAPLDYRDWVFLTSGVNMN